MRRILPQHRGTAIKAGTRMPSAPWFWNTDSTPARWCRIWCFCGYLLLFRLGGSAAALALAIDLVMALRGSRETPEAKR